MTTPVRAVLAALSDGAGSRAEVARRTGLRRDVVDAVLGHLVRTGVVQPAPTASGCPASGCGGCPVSSGCASSAGPVGLGLPVRRAG